MCLVTQLMQATSKYCVWKNKYQTWKTNVIVNIGILHSTWIWVYTIITTILHGIDVCVSFELNVNSHLVRYTDYQYNNSSLTVNSPCSIYSTWSWLPILRSPNPLSFCGRWWKWGSYMLLNLLMVRSWLRLVSSQGQNWDT